MATEYVVLKQEQQGKDSWRVAGHASAASGTAAVREVARVPDAEGVEHPEKGVYIAVPARSFQPLSLTFETVPRTVVKPLAKVAA